MRLNGGSLNAAPLNGVSRLRVVGAGAGELVLGAGLPGQVARPLAGGALLPLGVAFGEVVYRRAEGLGCLGLWGEGRALRSLPFEGMALLDVGLRGDVGIVFGEGAAFGPLVQGAWLGVRAHLGEAGADLALLGVGSGAVLVLGEGDAGLAFMGAATPYRVTAGAFSALGVGFEGALTGVRAHLGEGVACGELLGDLAGTRVQALWGGACWVLEARGSGFVNLWAAEAEGQNFFRPAAVGDFVRLPGLREWRRG